MCACKLYCDSKQSLLFIISLFLVVSPSPLRKLILPEAAIKKAMCQNVNIVNLPVWQLLVRTRDFCSCFVWVHVCMCVCVCVCVCTYVYVSSNASKKQLMYDYPISLFQLLHRSVWAILNMCNIKWTHFLHVNCKFGMISHIPIFCMYWKCCGFNE